MAARRIGKRENDNLRSFFYRLTPSKNYGGGGKGRSGGGTERLEEGGGRKQPACIPAEWDGNCRGGAGAAPPLTHCAFWQVCTPAARHDGGSCGQCQVNRSPVLWSGLVFTVCLLIVAVRWSSSKGGDDDDDDDDDGDGDGDDDDDDDSAVGDDDSDDD